MDRTTEIPLDRRQFLALGGAAAVATAAGCIERISEPPEYTEWLATDDDGGLLVAYVTFELDDDDREFDPLSVIGPSVTGDPGLIPDIEDDEIDDPLVRLPLDIGGGTIGLFVTGLLPTGLLEPLDPENEASESAMNELVVVNGTTIVGGTFDGDELDERLRENPDTFLEIGYESTDEIGEFTLYEPTTVPDELSDAGLLALGEEYLVYDSDRDAIERCIETKSGDHDRATETSETVEWLVEETGDGHILVGQVGPMPVEEFDFQDVVADDPAFLPEADEDVLAVVEFDPDGDELESRLAMANSDIDTETEEYLESELGAAATDSTVEIDDDRVSVRGTYDEDAIDIEFIDPDEDEEELPPEDVEAAVPEGALAFDYESPDADDPTGLGTAWVELLEEIEADALRVEATESGATNELTHHGNGIGADIDSSDDIDPSEGESDTLGPDVSLAVQAEPSGDELIVSVIIDDAVGEVTRETVP